MATNLDRKTLWRIVALLLSLAVLAERAATRPLVVRLVVFWILRRAELRARTLFGKPADAFDGEASASPRSGGGSEPDDLLRLAAGFRAMAALLSLPGWAVAGSGIGENAATGRGVPSLRDFARGFGTLRINDTS